MIKHKWIGAIATLLMAAAVIATGFAYGNPSAFASITGSSEPAYVEAMDKTQILNLQIVADEKEWADMLENATAEEYIPATVIINGLKIENVGIRPKGNSSLSMVAGDDTTERFSFKIEFDHYITGQTWLGLDKIAVNNMQGDASYLKEYLSYDIMAYVGVEAPLYAFADIRVNGEEWGFYLAVEVLEDSYAQRAYGNGHGKLYKPESMGMRGEGRMNEFIENAQNADGAALGGAGEQARPQGGMQFPGGGLPASQGNENPGFFGGMGDAASGGVSLQYASDDISAYSDIFDNSVLDATQTDYARVIAALKTLSDGEDLETVVNVEAVLAYFAAHTVVVNLDSYVSNMGHNYYLYEEDGQLTILPWDYNLAFGGFQSGNASSVVNFPIDTPVSGVSLEDRPLLGKLLEVPEYMALYHSYLQQIVDGYFNSGLFEQTIDSMNTLISSHVKADPSAFYDYETYLAAVAELKKLGLLRAQSIQGQLNGSIPSTSEGQSADSSTLVDASSITLSKLGSQGGMLGGFGGAARGQGEMGAGGNAGRAQGNMGGMQIQGVDREIMLKAMEILQASGGDELTGEQLAQLKELGLTDEQVTQLKTMVQGGFGGMSAPPGGLQGRGNNAAAGENPGFANQQPVTTASADTGTWLFVGSCTLLLLGGLGFVFFFKRRQGA